MISSPISRIPPSRPTPPYRHLRFFLDTRFADGIDGALIPGNDLPRGMPQGFPGRP
jgi:hypothetical protein